MTFKSKLQRGQKAALAWNQTGAAYTSEIFARAGFDGVIIDLEHGPFSLETTMHHCQALSCCDAAPFARIADDSASLIKRVLDTGIHGLLVPQVETAEQARGVVAATKYPPQGIRGVAGSTRAAGFGHRPLDYLSRANDDIFVAVAIESRTACENLDAILEVEGLDAIFIGPADLASSLGYLADPGQPEVQEYIASIEKSVIPSKKYLGTLCYDEAAIPTRFRRGYDFLMVMSDATYLSKEAHRLLGAIRAGSG